MASGGDNDCTYTINDKLEPGMVRVSFDLPTLKRGFLDGRKNAKKTSNAILNVSISAGSTDFGSVSIKGMTKGDFQKYTLKVEQSDLPYTWLGSPPSYYEVNQGVVQVFLKLVV